MLLRESTEEISPQRNIIDQSRTEREEPHHCKETTDSDSKRQREVHCLLRRSRGQVQTSCVESPGAWPSHYSMEEKYFCGCPFYRIGEGFFGGDFEMLK